MLIHLSEEAYDTSNLKFKSFSFKNYYIKQAVKDNVLYNGNKSAFLEPFEATAFSNTIRLTSDYFEHLVYDQPFHNDRYLEYIQESQEVILMHYLAGSKWDTEFWNNATNVAEDFFKNYSSDKFKQRIEKITKPYLKKNTLSFFYTQSLYEYNIFNLGIHEKLKSLTS
jgi:hypothetical protein